MADVPLQFQIHARSSLTGARAGTVTTAHGSFRTPVFMPVGTQGTVKGVYPHQLKALGAEIVLNNTYHLLLRPGPELVERRGGVQAFMNWDGPILTDSGGYQAYSMADINAVDDDGVTFKSILDGSTVRLTPESVVQTQNALGSDIIMPLDDCPPSVDPGDGPVNQTRIRLAAKRDAGGRGKRARYDHAERLRIANERTVRWLERCKAANANPERQSLFGIVQGGTDLERRSQSAEAIGNIELPGYAIGGVAVGESGDDIARVVRHTAPLLPEDKPRYLMGVGYERDLVAAVCAGVDMFDCVLPTRNGRNANAFVNLPDEPKGQIRIRNSRFKEDDRPIQSGCDCPACAPWMHGWATPIGPDGWPRAYTRAYLRHLFLADEMLGPMLVSLHNIRYFVRLMEALRGAIATDAWDGFAHAWPNAAAGLPAGLLGRTLSKTDLRSG